MKLPKRLSEVLKRKEDWIAGREAKLQTAIMKMQEALLARTMSEIIPKLETTNGKIRNTLKNYQLLASLDKMYKDFEGVQRLAFVSEIGDTAKGIMKFNSNFFTVSMGAALPELFKEILKNTSEILDLRVGLKGGEIVGGSFLDDLIANKNLLLELKQFMGQAVSAQIPTKDFIKGFNDLIVGIEDKPGGMDKQFKRFAHDVFMQYDRAYAATVADKAGMKYFIYLGGKITDSRDFCVAHDGKVWSNEDAKKWTTWTPADGEYPAGYEIKQKDINKVPSYLNYPGYAPRIDLGGYNCRHHLGYIMDELAYQMKPELKADYNKAPEGVEGDGKMKVPDKKEIPSDIQQATNIQEAELMLKERGVEYVNLKGMSLEHANQMLYTIQVIPKSAIPNFFGTGTEFDNIMGGVIGRSGRKAEQWYGISLTNQVYRKSANDFVTIKAIGINSRKYSSLDDITAQKLFVNDNYLSRTGRDWFFNTTGEATHFHETGHIFEQAHGLPQDWNFQVTKWFNEAKVDILRSPKEAWGEAWADLYSNEGKRLPSYIKGLMEEYIKRF